MDEKTLTNRGTVRLTIAGIIALALTASAAADNLLPPSWRGEDGSTWSQWEFYTGNPTPPPDDGYNPYGLPDLLAIPGYGQSWHATWGGREGVWPLAGIIQATIPTNPLHTSYRDFQVQVTWIRDVPGESPYVWEMGTGIEGTLLQRITLERSGLRSPSTYWYHSTYTFHLDPDTAPAVIRIEGGIMVDELVIDARTVPEPATLALLALGAAAIVIRRRR